MKKLKLFKTICLLMISAALVFTGCGNKETISEETAETSSIKGEDEEYAYRNIVLDRSLTKGKLAVYYFQGMERESTHAASSNSGDGILIITPSGKTMVVDTNVNANTPYLVYALQELGIDKIDYFVNTHPHPDHIGGFAILARHIEIGEIFTPPATMYTKVGTSANVNKFRQVVEGKDIKWSYMAEGDTLTLDKDVEIKVYNPPADLDWGTVNENEWSIAMKLTYKDSSYFLGGDIGNDLVRYKRDTINQMITKYGDELKTDIVKMNHHGGDNSQSNPQEWLDTVQAKLYVGTFHTVSYDVAYFRMASTGADVLHTALDGTVVVYTTGDGTYDVQVEGDRYSTLYGTPDTENGHMRIE